MPTVTLLIRPQTYVRSVQGDKIYFRIPVDQLRPEGLKRRLRLEKYNQYKIDLFDLAQEQDLVLPTDGYFRVMYFIPMPKSWKKWKYHQHNMRAHQVKPDKNNLDKALEDALLRRDQAIWDSRSTKIWTDHPTGYIQIIWGDDLEGQ